MNKEDFVTPYTIGLKDLNRNKNKEKNKNLEEKKLTLESICTLTKRVECNMRGFDRSCHLHNFTEIAECRYKRKADSPILPF